jgi:hypothetical protein
LRSLRRRYNGLRDGSCGGCGKRLVIVYDPFPPVRTVIGCAYIARLVAIVVGRYPNNAAPNYNAIALDNEHTPRFVYRIV